MTAFENALNICIDKVRQGEWTLDECLERFPQFGTGLAPLLHLALDLDVSSAPSQPMPASSRARIRESLLARIPAGEAEAAEPAVEVFSQRPRRSTIGSRLFRPRWASAVATLFLVFSTGGLAVAASGSDATSPLFPIKRAVENVRVLLTPNQGDRADLLLRYAERRAEEAEKLTPTHPEAAKRTLDMMDRGLETARAAAGEIEAERAEKVETRIEDLSDRHHELETRLEDRGRPGAEPANEAEGKRGRGGEGRDEKTVEPGEDKPDEAVEKEPGALPEEQGKGDVEEPVRPGRKGEGGKGDVETPPASGEGTGPSGVTEDRSGKAGGDSRLKPTPPPSSGERGERLDSGTDRSREGRTGIRDRVDSQTKLLPAPKDKQSGKLRKRSGKKPGKNPTTTTTRNDGKSGSGKIEAQTGSSGGSGETKDRSAESEKSGSSSSPN